MENTITLDTLSPGETAVVQAMEEADSALCRRLFAMGIVKGVEIKILAMSPFGDPISVGLRGYVLSLRKEELRILRGVKK
ncbi:MAG: FeoA family protein [Candidatus Enteromonas sp.]|nr:FeoA family protein [Candidatus Enteromonas sp.]MDY6093444.1 FeoA family protein [Candidatus Enteromonas sp.]